MRGLIALMIAAIAVVCAFSAVAAWRAMSAHPGAAVGVAGSSGYEADDHFPGAAELYLADSATRPSGATGTIALPPLPVSEARAQAFVAAETGIVPARPFSMAAASGLDRARALECLTDAIYYEAASEPDEGQRAVAQVVLNRARHPAFPATVCGVVFQGSERRYCQFSFACDGAMARIPSRAAWTRASRVAAAALAGYVYAPVGLATHYHTYAVTPSWNRTLVMTDVVGAHFFHRWKGYWGTAAAFTQSYRGGEPVPGPHGAPATPLAPDLPLVATAPPPPMPGAAPAMPAPVTAPSTIQPDHAQSSVMTAPPPSSGDRLPPASQVLDRWRDSGKPL